MTYGLETTTLTKKQETELETAKLKTLRFSIGVSRMGKIRNRYVWGTAHMRRHNLKIKEGRLRWCGHVRRKEEGYIR